MLKQLKNSLFSKFFVAIFLYLWSFQASAQSSFIIELKEEYNAKDICEDEKGRYVFSDDSYVYRLNSSGGLLWLIRNSGLDKIKQGTDGKSLIMNGVTSGVGGYRMASIDYKGKILWNVRIETGDVGTSYIFIYDFIVDSLNKQIVLAGVYGKVGSNNYSYWFGKATLKGELYYSKVSKDQNESRYYTKIFKNKKTGGYMLLSEDWETRNRHELLSVDSFGNIVNRNAPVNKPCDSSRIYYDYKLLNFQKLNDSMFFGSVYLVSSTSCPNNPNEEAGVYWYFYSADGTVLYRRKISDNEGTSDLQAAKYGGFIGVGYNAITGVNELIKLDKDLKHVWTKTLYTNKESESIYVIKAYQSRDGGYYGISEGTRILTLTPRTEENIIYIFKTDSLGNINPKHEFSEKQQPMMLQPNPAQHAVRIAIPYYFGNISASFYDLHGRLLFEKTQNEQIPFDIRTLATGVYVVKAKVLETGEQRTMKLMVE